MLETELEADNAVTDVEVVIPLVIGELEEALLLTIDPEKISEEVIAPVVVKIVEVTPLEVATDVTAVLVNVETIADELVVNCVEVGAAELNEAIADELVVN